VTRGTTEIQSPFIFAPKTKFFKMADSGFSNDFMQAVFVLKNGKKLENGAALSDDDKLKYYALFKQAVFGECPDAAPWAVQIVAKAKWQAWTDLKGMTKEDAMQGYVDHMTSNDPEWRTRDGHPAVLEKMTAENFQQKLE